MNVSEIMGTPIQEIMDKDTVIRAAGKMRNLDVGALVTLRAVTTQYGRPVTSAAGY